MKFKVTKEQKDFIKKEGLKVVDEFMGIPVVKRNNKEAEHINDFVEDLTEETYKVAIQFAEDQADLKELKRQLKKAVVETIK